MTPTTIHIPIFTTTFRGDGGQTDRALSYWKPTRAIVLHKLFAIHAPGRGYRTKRITHLPTGYGIITVQNLDTAIALCDKLFAMPINWHFEEGFAPATLAYQIQLVLQEMQAQNKTRHC
jgi:hypothetical protein